MPEDTLETPVVETPPAKPAAPAAPAADPSNTDPNPGGPTGVGEEDIDSVMERNFSELMGEKPSKPADKPPSQIAKPADKPAKPAEKPAAPTAKPGDKPPEKQQEKQDKPPEKQVEKPAAVAPESKVKRPWEIVRQKEKDLAELESKYKALEQEHSRYKAMGDPGAPNAEVENLKKQLEEKDQKIQYLEYSQSDKFAKEHQKPYEQLAQNLTVEAMKMIVRNSDGTARALTREEFWKVAATASVNDAAEEADKIFPEDPTKANILVNMRNAINETWNKMEAAKAEYRTKAGEIKKQTAAQQAQAQAREQHMARAREQKWRQMSEAAIKNERLKDYFVAADDDAKGKELLTKGFKDADRAFNGGAPLDDGDEPLNEDQMIELHATIRNKAGAFNYVAHQYRMAKAEIEDLKKELEDFRKSDPSKDDPGAGGGGGGEDIDETERGLRELEGRQ
jgi:major membrane immunogen (membrane-anchored lipoprotein)